MKRSRAETVRTGIAAAALAASLAIPAAKAASEHPIFMSVSGGVRAPIGWIEFCSEYAPECETKPLEPRDVVLNAKASKEMARINRWANDTIKPITDLEHWGVVERWNYPDDGYGVKTDRGEYVLDNQNEEILLWTETGYRFVKRQSQRDPNVWVSLGDPRAAGATAASR